MIRNRGRMACLLWILQSNARWLRWRLLSALRSSRERTRLLRLGCFLGPGAAVRDRCGV